MVAGSVGAYENKIVKYFTVHCTKSYFNIREHTVPGILYSIFFFLRRQTTKPRLLLRYLLVLDETDLVCVVRQNKQIIRR